MSNDWQSDAALIKFSYRSGEKPRSLPDSLSIVESYGSEASGVRIDVLRDYLGNYTVLARGTAHFPNVVADLSLAEGQHALQFIAEAVGRVKSEVDANGGSVTFLGHGYGARGLRALREGLAAIRPLEPGCPDRAERATKLCNDAGRPLRRADRGGIGPSG